MHRLKSVITLLDRLAIFLADFPSNVDTCILSPCVSVFASSFVSVVLLDVLLRTLVLDELVLVLVVLDELSLLLVLLLLELDESSEELSLSDGVSCFGLPFRLFVFFFFILALSMLFVCVTVKGTLSILLLTSRFTSDILCVSVGVSSVVYLSTSGSCNRSLAGLGPTKLTTCSSNVVSLFNSASTYL